MIALRSRGLRPPLHRFRGVTAPPSVYTFNQDFVDEEKYGMQGQRRYKGPQIDQKDFNNKKWLLLAFSRTTFRTSQDNMDLQVRRYSELFGPVNEL